MVRLQLGPFVTHFLYHPDHVSRVLRERQQNYLRGWQYKLLRSLFDDNLVTSEGEFWRRQRRLAQPAFHHQRLSAYANVMVGPHQCIGNEFAMLEMQLVVAMAAQQFDFELLPGSEVRPAAALTLNPSGPVRIKLRRIRS